MSRLTLAVGSPASMQGESAAMCSSIAPGVTDVSRDGFKLESRSELEVGSQVILLVTKMTPVKALIRWTRGLEAGGVFLEAGAL